MNFASLFFLNKKLKRIAKFPIISIVHLLDSNIRKNFFYRVVIRKIEKMYFKSIDGLIFNSEATKLSVISLIGKNMDSLVAYPGKDRLKLDNVNLSLDKSYYDKLMVIFIGNLLYHKGLHVLLKALADIETQLWQLTVIGNLELDSKYLKHILKLISQRNLKNNVRLLGLLNGDNLKKELVAHHVLAVPSYYESFGIVYVEAMGET